MASPLIVANNVASQLVANIGPSDTAILLPAGQGARFPAPASGEYFYATLVHASTGAVEVVKCTARSVDTLTVVRGQDNTTAISVTYGSVVEMREVAAMFREIDWRTNAGAANGALQLDSSGFAPDARIPPGITRDSELNAAINGVAASIPPALGFTPVQQGTGVGQAANTVKIGWKTGSKLGLTIDASDLGNFLLSGDRGVANGVASLDASAMVPIAQIPALGYLPTAGGTMTGVLLSTFDIATTAVLQSGQDFRSSTATAVLATTGAGNVFLRPNGAGSAAGQLQLTSGGVATATNFTATSDFRLKKDVQRTAPRSLDMVEFCRFVWADSGKRDLGVIAQQVQDVFPEYVYENEGGMLSVDKASLALEAVFGLLACIKDLEAKLG